MDAPVSIYFVFVDEQGSAHLQGQSSLPPPRAPAPLSENPAQRGRRPDLQQEPLILTPGADTSSPRSWGTPTPKKGFLIRKPLALRPTPAPPLKDQLVPSGLGPVGTFSLGIHLSGKELSPHRPPSLAIKGGGGFLA